ncbi:protein FAM216A-like [Dicentrarchus labrax]|uniref:protein FAM216A-like n=1 Tax=Dicentrarchus labrax TaxID=13489 RepID=UPI0021F5E888|nr:protein FAM216A-like [Dicentrarchus labrax]
MRKRVTFVEQLKKENLLKNGSGHILKRTTESNNRCTDGFECQQVREMYRGTHTNVSAGGQHMKTIHIPKSLMSAPFLQHPALTAGQRRYLCSIANIYSTEHMRQQMKQHYLKVLRTCVQSGQNPTCRRRYGDHQHRENSVFTKDAEKDVARAKPQGQRKGNSSSSTAHSDVILPKIVNR